MAEKLKNHKHVYRSFESPEDESIEDFIRRLREESEGIVNPVITMETCYDCDSPSEISGFVPLTEKEIATAKRRRATVLARKKKQAQKLKERELKDLERLAKKHGLVVRPGLEGLAGGFS